MAPARPHGRFLAGEVGDLVGVSGTTIGQWARRGYIASSQSEGPPRIYSYQDVAEAMVVHELLQRGVPHADIKTAIQTLREDYGAWPLTHAPIAISHKRVVTERAGVVYDLGRGWQATVNPENLERIATQLNRGGWAVREAPEIERIEVNPARLSGRPTIRGRRLPATKVAWLADSAEGKIILRTDYAVTNEEINDASRWWGVVRELIAA